MFRSAAALLLTAFAHVAEPANAAENLTIVSWNMHFLADTLYEKLNADAGVARTNSDYSIMAQELVALEADIVLAQEVENEEALTKVLGEGFDIWFGPSIEAGGNQSSIQTAVAVKKGIGAEPLSWQLIPRMEAVYVDDGQLQFLRGVAGASVPLGQQKLHVLSLHIKSSCPDAINMMSSYGIDCMMADFQLRQLVRWARNREDTLYVLGGDFNQNWDSGTEATLSERFRSEVQIFPDDGVSRCPQRPKRLDYFVVSGDLLVSQFQEKQLNEHALYYGAEISDHCPISILVTAAPTTPPSTKVMGLE